MDSTIQLIDLLGAVALLLWGLRLIKTGVLRAYGATLRRWLARGAANRWLAAFWGFLATLGLQSSTASAVIIASFTARDIVQPRMAQAMMLGANLGTAIVTLILSTDVHWLASAAIFVGVVLFQVARLSRNQNLGRAVLGLGLMLLALQLLGTVTDPLRESPTVTAILSGLEDAPVFAVLIAAGLAVLGSSSLAVVVLIMMLAAAGIVGPELSLWLVAGANLGGAVPPWLAVRSEGVAAQRVTLANLIVRGTGAVAVMLLAGPLADLLGRVVSDPALFVVSAHIGFSAILLIIFMPLLGPVARLVENLRPDDPHSGRVVPNYLDDNLLQIPEMALAVAARETLRLGDIVGEMLEQTRIALAESDETAGAEVARLEAEVDRLYEAIKLYVARVSRNELDAADERRASEIISYAINLEHIGDIIQGGLSETAGRKVQRKLAFSPEGQAEISEFYRHTQENLRIAQAIILSRDASLARRLVAQKVESRKLEAQSAERHLLRMRGGRIESMETSAIHLDLLRDLKRVNAHIASVAYPILDELGVLNESRLQETG